MPENIAATALGDAFCEEIAVQSIVDVQSYRIAAHIVSNSCVNRLLTFSTASTTKMTVRWPMSVAVWSTVRVDRVVSHPSSAEGVAAEVAEAA